METRVAVMSIIVENGEMVETLNAILHEYGEYIIGRMGIPYRKRKVSIIAIALDAPQNTISALSGKVGSLKGISVKTKRNRGKFTFLSVDIAFRLCYHNDKILTLSFLGCVKGANMGFRPQIFLWQISVAVPSQVRYFLFWRNVYGNPGSGYEHHCREQ